MPTTAFGLPLHPLLVHATVVFVPLAVLAVLGAVLVPRFRTWAGPVPMLLSLLALILTPLSTASGENLEHQVRRSDLVEQHAQLGDQLLPFTIALFVLAVAFWSIGRYRGRMKSGTASTDLVRVLTLVIGGLALLAALGTGVQVVRIGHSGAQAAWSDVGGSGPG